MKQYTYLLINFFSILIPFLFSFERRIFFFKKMRALLPALIITGAFFIIWDHLMTVWNVWGFNREYLIGYYLWDLPIEEWLFFFTIPYSCDIGTWAEEITIPSNYCAKIPTNIDVKEAGTIALPLLTAYDSLTQLNTKKGEKILIHGTGGCGGNGSGPGVLRSKSYAPPVSKSNK